MKDGDRMVLEERGIFVSNVLAVFLASGGMKID